MLHWLLLLLAITLEVAGTTCMRLSHGFTKPVPSVLLFVFYAASLSVLTLALKRIEISVAYAVWSGLGTALIATIGFVYFRDFISPLKVVSIVLIVVGVIGLNLSTGGHGAALPAAPSATTTPH